MKWFLSDAKKVRVTKIGLERGWKEDFFGGMADHKSLIQIVQILSHLFLRIPHIFPFFPIILRPHLATA